jgi:hypothetical protein
MYNGFALKCLSAKPLYIVHYTLTFPHFFELKNVYVPWM